MFSQYAPDLLAGVRVSQHVLIEGGGANNTALGCSILTSAAMARYRTHILTDGPETGSIGSRKITGGTAVFTAFLERVIAEFGTDLTPKAIFIPDLGTHEGPRFRAALRAILELGPAYGVHLILGDGGGDAVPFGFEDVQAYGIGTTIQLYQDGTQVVTTFYRPTIRNGQPVEYETPIPRRAGAYLTSHKNVAVDPDPDV